jgi:simple sugar transport system permease protein
MVFRTRWGLEVRACGENPQSADVSGIHVNHRRRQAIYVTGITTGIAGAFLLLGQAGGVFSPDMTAFRGFLAIAAVIFGGWTLRGTLAGCAVFALAGAANSAVQATGNKFNSQLLASLPYVLALGAMVVFAKRTRQPAALAQPFIRGLV